MKRKGIILAGGSGTRLYPLTKVISKQLLPVFDKPMIYYPLSTLMLAGIRDILIITNAKEKYLFEELLGDGHEIGIKIDYTTQNSPRGIAEALLIAEDFLDNHPSALILGDNIFYGGGLNEKLNSACQNTHGGTVFLHRTDKPEQYGVAEVDHELNILAIEEKPSQPKSNYAVTGLYFYDNRAPEIAKSLMPSKRGELEITDLNNVYAKEAKLFGENLGENFTWFDAGTFTDLLNAGHFISIVEKRSKQKVACLEQISFQKNYINSHQLNELAIQHKDHNMTAYLKNICKEAEHS